MNWPIYKRRIIVSSFSWTERKSLCHGFLVAGVFKRFGFEAVRREAPDTLSGFCRFCHQKSFANKAPKGNVSPLHSFGCLPFDHLHYEYWFVAYVFTVSPLFWAQQPQQHLLDFAGFSRRTGGTSGSVHETQHNGISLFFCDSGATVCYQEWTKKSNVIEGSVSNLRVPPFSFLKDLNHIPLIFCGP